MSDTIQEIRARNLYRRLKTARAVQCAAAEGWAASMKSAAACGIEARRNLAARGGAWRGMADGLVDLITREVAQ